MNNEQKRRELEKLHRRKTDELMGVCTRLTTFKADVAKLELKRNQLTIDLVAIIQKQKEMGDDFI